MSNDLWFERLAQGDGGIATEAAPARLKSKVYSALVARMAETGALLGLADTKAAGSRLCVFENALTLLPLGTGIHSMNPCRICHARVLGERMTRAPIFWQGCPYSDFHNG
jgi:hypothetical protein